jgi:TetR/AcrR family transcriptional regulator
MKPDEALLNNEASSKERIIHAAQELFAQKGFEGARVDEIAHMAGVNKALIYYYFKSKEEILHALIHHAMEEFISKLDGMLKHRDGLLQSKELLHEALVQFLNMIDADRDLFTIVIAELLKDTDRRTLILSHLNEVLLRHDRFFPQFKPIDDSGQGAIVEFFTGFVPFIMFVLLKDSWKTLYKQDESVLREMFLAAFEATHVRYSLDMLESTDARSRDIESKEEKGGTDL